MRGKRGSKAKEKGVEYKQRKGGHNNRLERKESEGDGMKGERYGKRCREKRKKMTREKRKDDGRRDRAI